MELKIADKSAENKKSDDASLKPKEINAVARKHNVIFFSMIKLMALPAVILTIALFIIVFISFSFQKESLEKSTSNTLLQVASQAENNISNLIDASSLLSGNQILKSALTDTQSEFSPAVSNELLSFKQTFGFIDNLFIINKNKGLVCTTDGTYTINKYFTDICKYNDYSPSFWTNFNFYNTSVYRALSPSVTVSDGKSNISLPIVFRTTGKLLNKNFFVCNINIKELINCRSSSDDIEKYGIDIYMLNRYSGEVFLPDGSSFARGHFPDELYDLLLENSNASFDYKLDGGKIITTYSNVSSLIGYSYFSILDKKIILLNMLPNILISIAIMIIFLIIAFIFVLKNTTYLSSSLNNIYDTVVDSDVDLTDNPLDDIVSGTQKAAKAKYELTQTLSCAQEKYLINYLNATEYYIEESTRNIIKETLSFPHEYFMVLILQVSPTIKLFNHYTSQQYENIRQGLYKLIKSLFDEKFPYCILLGTQEPLYIILNIESPDKTALANDILLQIDNLLQNDLDHITLSIGKSNAYKGIKGLKMAHQEAKDNLSSQHSDTNNILLNSQSNTDFDFGSREESDLFAALLSMNKQKIYEILNVTFERNKLMPDKAQKNLYCNIMNMIVNTFSLKKFDLPDSESDKAVLDDFSKLSIYDMKSTVMKYIDYLLGFNPYAAENTNNSSDMDTSIIQYIENNYTYADLSINYLADYFHMNPSTISLTIKNALGTGFHQYISLLRVNKAKELLLTSDKSINEICTECGFASQQTFYRTFKKITGVTTSEFRKANQNNTPADDSENDENE